MNRKSALLGLLLLPSLLLRAGEDLGPDQMSMLQDSSGWVYLSMNDSQDGFPTQHTCFDGKAHPESCSGRLTLSPDYNFVQEVSIHNQSVSRHGTYELKGDKLAFFDEFGTRDGPYTVRVDVQNKMLAMDMPMINVKLQLYKEYQKLQQTKRKAKK